MNDQISQSAVIRILWLLTFSIIVVVTIHPITTPDFWWHIASARYILEQGTFPTTDVFNFTSNNSAWIAPTWLAQITFYLAFLLGDAALVIIIKAAIIGCTFFMMYKTITPTRRNSLPALIIILAAYIESRYRFIARPQIFFYFYVITLIYLLNMVNDSKRFKLALYFIALTIFGWVNTHGSIIFAYIIGGIYLGEQIVKYFAFQKSTLPVRKYFWILIIVILTSLINPYSYQTFVYPLKIRAQTFQISVLAEYNPPGFNNIFGLFEMFLMLLPLVLIQLFRARNYSGILLLIFFGYLGVSYTRFTGLFIMVAAPLYVNFFPRIIFKIENRSLVAGIFALILILMGNYHLKPQLVGKKAKPLGMGIVWDKFPRQAAEFIKRNLADKHGLNQYMWGGYLDWVLYPQKTFIDGRQLEDNAPFHEWYRVFESKQNFNKIVEKYDIDYLIWNKLPQGIEQYESVLLPPEEWRLVFWDKISVIYLRNTRANQPLIKANQFKYLHPMQTSFDYLSSIKERQAVIAELERSVVLDPQNSRAYFYLAFLHDEDKSFTKAIGNYLKVLELDDFSAEAAYRLAKIYQYQLKNSRSAQKYYKLTLRIRPDHVYALNNLAFFSLQEKSWREAEKHLLKALKIQPNYFYARYNLVRLYKESNSPKLRAVYQWFINNPQTVPPNYRQILDEARKAISS